MSSDPVKPVADLINLWEMERTLGTTETICNALAYSEKLGKDLRPSDCIGKVLDLRDHLRPKEDWRKLHNPERNNGEVS